MKPVKVLILEDSKSDFHIIFHILKKKLIFEITRVDRLEQASLALKLSSFDISLIDLFVPDSEGLQTLKSILEIAPQMPVIVLTGLHDEKTGRAAIEMGAEDYLCKDISIEHQLSNAIYFAIIRHQRLQEAFLSIKPLSPVK